MQEFHEYFLLQSEFRLVSNAAERIVDLHGDVAIFFTRTARCVIAVQLDAETPQHVQHVEMFGDLTRVQQTDRVDDVTLVRNPLVRDESVNAVSGAKYPQNVTNTDSDVQNITGIHGSNRVTDRCKQRDEIRVRINRLRRNDHRHVPAVIIAHT